MLTPEQIVDLRTQLKMDVVRFAKLLGVDTRTVLRWESGIASPSGTAEAVIIALSEQLRRDEYGAENTIRFVTNTSAVGGLPYLMLKLFEFLSHQNLTAPKVGTNMSYSYADFRHQGDMGFIYGLTNSSLLSMGDEDAQPSLKYVQNR